jgi:hypothetical protein
MVMAFRRDPEDLEYVLCYRNNHRHSIYHRDSYNKMVHDCTPLRADSHGTVRNPASVCRNPWHAEHDPYFYYVERCRNSAISSDHGISNRTAVHLDRPLDPSHGIRRNSDTACNNPEHAISHPESRYAAYSVRTTAKGPHGIESTTADPLFLPSSRTHDIRCNLDLVSSNREHVISHPESHHAAYSVRISAREPHGIESMTVRFSFLPLNQNHGNWYRTAVADSTPQHAESRQAHYHERTAEVLFLHSFWFEMDSPHENMHNGVRSRHI